MPCFLTSKLCKYLQLILTWIFSALVSICLCPVNTFQKLVQRYNVVAKPRHTIITRVGITVCTPQHQPGSLRNTFLPHTKPEAALVDLNPRIKGKLITHSHCASWRNEPRWKTRGYRSPDGILNSRKQLTMIIGAGKRQLRGESIKRDRLSLATLN